MKRSASTSSVVLNIDPRLFNPSCLPIDTHREEASRLNALIIQDLAQHSPARRDLTAWAAQCWHRIRDEVVRGDGLTVSALLSQPQFASVTRTILEIAEGMLDARARRADLAAQLAALDAVEDMFTSAKQAEALR